jgi:hypothetical protein
MVLVAGSRKKIWLLSCLLWDLITKFLPPTTVRTLCIGILDLMMKALPR